MKILIDIGHPAHVHYFRNFIKLMTAQGHEFLITARDKEITLELLKKYGLQYVNRGKGGNGAWGKLKYMFKADWLLYKVACKFKPDAFLSFASTYAAHASFIYRKPHIAIDDTEHAKFELFLYPPFTEVILTPFCFLKDLGKKQIRFNSYVEFSYLHPDFFKPDNTIRTQLNLGNDEKFVLFRFISWTASHDIGQAGIPYDIKRELIELCLKNGYKVFISSERELTGYFEQFRLNVDTSKIHSVIYEASFLIGESGTMSTEACILGTPAVFVNTLNAGVFMDEEKRGLLYSYRTPDGIVEKVESLLNQKSIKDLHKQKSQTLLNETINVTKFLMWFILNYPKSKIQMQKNPDYQNNFK